MTRTHPSVLSLLEPPLVVTWLPSSNKVIRHTLTANELHSLTADSGLTRHQDKVNVELRVTVAQSVSLGVEPHLGLMTRYLLLFDSRGLVFLGRPL
jgi:hypothetical protein